MKTLQQAITDRRSYYSISEKSLVSDTEIKNLIDLAVRHVPSAFNSQSTRTVLLLGKHHKKLWDITKDELKKIDSEIERLQSELMELNKKRHRDIKEGFVRNEIDIFSDGGKAYVYIQL